MDLEDDLTRLLRGVTVPGPSADPVPAVHAGMRRRRRAQRLTVASSALGVLALVAAATVLVQDRTGAGPSPFATETGLPPTPVASAVPSTSAAPADPTAVPESFSAGDVSFVDADRGWALGTASCGSTPCTVQLVTTDSGQTWVRRPARGLPRACQPNDPECVTQVRFVDERVGYAYGPGLYVTSDGGKSWTRQNVGGTVAGLEIAGGTVVRVVTQCLPGCPLTVQTSAVGSFTWRPTWTGTVRAGAELLRQGDRVVVVERGNTAGGAGQAQTRLLVSSDAGEHWTEQSDPCAAPNGSPEVDATRLGIGPVGTTVAICVPRQAAADREDSVRFSSDSGRTFGGDRDVPRFALTVLPTGPGEAVAYVLDGGPDPQQLLRTADGGATWDEVAAAPASEGGGGSLVRSTASVLSWVPRGGDVLWQSSDGGASWTSYPFRP